MTTGTYANATDYQKATNAQHADVIPAIEVLGGDYWIVAVASSWNAGSLDFKITAADGSTGTAISVLAAAFAANGIKTVTLPPCSLQPVIATTDSVYWSFVRIARK